MQLKQIGAEMVQESKVKTWERVADCKPGAQCKGGVWVDSMSSLHCNGREARLARDGIREHVAFLGHEMRGPAWTGRCGVSTAGRQQGQGAGKGEGVRGHRLPPPPCILENLHTYFCFLSRWKRLLANICSIYSHTWILIYFIWFHKQKNQKKRQKG